MRLTGPQGRQLLNVLSEAFSKDELAELVRYSLETPLENIVGDKGLRAVVLAIIEYAERRDAIDRLILDARQLNPQNEALAELAGTLQMTPDAALFLERIIPGQYPIFDPAEWRQSMVDAENRVCQIEIRGAPIGSGFLVGADLVLTNFHVVAGVIAEAVPPIVMHFDYTSQRSEAKAYGVATPWLVDASKPSPLDEHPVEGQDPTIDELDYALLRLDTPVGSQPVNDAAPGDRGWFSLRQEPIVLNATDDVVIMQHPGGGPRRCAIADFIGLNANATRMRYLTDTEPGSSGSPCFDLGWRLIGLHHSSEPKPVSGYNEGIPLTAIAARLGRQQLLAGLT
jgi:hypothetical protein